MALHRISAIDFVWQLFNSPPSGHRVDVWRDFRWLTGRRKRTCTNAYGESGKFDKRKSNLFMD